MKALLLAGLLFFGPIRPAPFIGANTIIIEAAGNDTVALNKLAGVARSQGYEIDTLTEQKLTTVPRAYEFRRYGIITPVTHKFRATMSGANIELTGIIRGQLNNRQQFETGMGWYGEKEESQNKACFTQAQKIANAYPDGKVGYLKRP